MTRIRPGSIHSLVRAACSSTLLLAASTLLSVSPAAAAEVDLCRGHWVRNLAGPHAVLRQTLVDVASLRQRLPELETSIRAVIARDASLSPAVADALIAAIRDGSSVRERQMQRDEAVVWMAYQPEPGRFEAIAPACLRLERKYEAFEITVEVPDAVPVAQAATCVISAVRGCADDRREFSIDTRGSSPGARVTLAIDGQPAAAISGPGGTWTVPDPGTSDLEAIFTVRAAGGPVPARMARVYRFLMPRVCGNLAYLGEAAARTISPAGASVPCEKSVVVGRCGPAVVGVPPVAIEPDPVVADRCVDGWTVRPFLFGYFPMGDERRRDILLPWTGPARESFEVDKGYGLGASLERRLGPVFGLEGAVMVGRGTSEYRLDDGRTRGHSNHDVTFQALTVGPNFHFLGCGGVDLYLGPFVGYGGFADPNYWVNEHRFVASFDRRFLWGAQLGLDVPFGSGPWGFHGGLRYLDLSQDTDAGSLQVDPLLVELGLAYTF